MTTSTENRTAIAAALRARIGQIMPMNDLKVWMDSDGDWNTCSTLTPTPEAVAHFVLRADLITTDEDGKVVGYMWGEEPITSEALDSDWEDYIRGWEEEVRQQQEWKAAEEELEVEERRAEQSRQEFYDSLD